MTLLFPSHAGTPVSHAIAPAIDTPHGVVEFGVAIGGSQFSEDLSEAFTLAPSGARLVWRTDAHRVELLLTPWEWPDIPGTRSVEACWAAIFRIYTESETKRLEVNCAWAPGSSWTQAQGPQTGENLDAQAWSDGHTVVAIGTADAAALAGASSVIGTISPRWRDQFHGNRGYAMEFVQYSRAGFRLRLPNLEPGERAQVHFLIAWGREHSNDVGPWLAVEMTPDEVNGALER